MMGAGPERAGTDPATAPRAHLVSIQVGVPRTRGADDAPNVLDQSWTSAIFKASVNGPLWLGRTNLVGDRQADTKNHGGPDKAVLAYAATHYPSWRRELGRPDLAHGAFGENFTIGGLDESTVCIGDIFAIGAARVQVSQPRQPCWKLNRRWRMEDLLDRVRESGRTGWYLRVLEEGEVVAGLPVTLLDRPLPRWTVARAGSVMRRRHEDPEAAAELAASELLAASWRMRLAAART